MSDATDIAFGEVSFTHDDLTTIGTCDPLDTSGLICTGGSVTTP